MTMLFTPLYFSDPSGSNILFLSSLLVSHRSRNSAVTQCFFIFLFFYCCFCFCFLFVFRQCLPRISPAVSVTAVLQVVVIKSMSIVLLFMMEGGANFLLVIAWKVFNALGSFSFSRSNVSLECFGLLILFSRGGRSSSASRSHF